MSNVTIGELPAASAITGTELVELEQSGVSVKSASSAIFAISYYKQTSIESSNSITPVQYQYAPGTPDRYTINTTPGTTDMTSALQASSTAVGAGGRISLLSVTYGISSTVSILEGQSIVGQGWGSHTGVFGATSGSIIKVISNSNFDVISHIASSGTPSLGHYFANFGITGFGSGSTNNIGIHLEYCPWTTVINVYCASMHIGIEQGAQCFRWFTAAYKGLDCDNAWFSHDEGEDSSYHSCDFGSYRSTGVGFQLSDMGQCLVFNACSFAQNNFGFLMSQGDTNGNGTGTPYPMHAVLIGCIFEDNLSAGIGITSSNQSAAATLYPALTCIGCRGNMTGTFGTPNSGQSFLFGLHYSQIKISDLILNTGFSYGAVIYTSMYSFTASGTAPGQLIWEEDYASTYGTSRFLGTTANVSVGSFGDTQLCRLTPASFSYTGGAGYARVPFSTVLSDTWGWYESSNVAISPTRQNQTVKFHVRVSFASVPTGQVLLAIYKNNSPFKTIAATTVSTAGNDLILYGQCEDVPTSGAYYYAAINAIQNLTLDTANSDFYAELVGS